MEWNLESKDYHFYLGFLSMGRHDWMRARDNEKAIGSDRALQKSAFQSSINRQCTLSTKLPNPIFYLSSSRFVKKAEMETPVYISYFLGKKKIMRYKRNMMRI